MFLFTYIQFVAIVDPLVDKARLVLQTRKSSSYGNMYSECVIYPTLEEFLRVKSADAVLIGIPPVFRGSLERDVEVKCLEAGLHCFIEKPISVTEPNEFAKYCDKLVKTQKQKNAIASVGYMFR